MNAKFMNIKISLFSLPLCPLRPLRLKNLYFLNKITSTINYDSPAIRY
jgi:hypothetical protein